MSFTVNQAFDLIKSAHQRGRLGHAFLITGPKGCGKEELAARMADMLNGEAAAPADLWGEPEEKTEPSLDEVSGDYVRVVRPRSKSRRIPVDDIRELEKMFHQSSPDGTWKIGVIVDADRMNESSENAFLKTLEEPPPGSLLMLLSGEPQRLLPTIWSRCVHLPLRAQGGLGQREEVADLIPLLEKATSAGLQSLEASLALKGAFEELLAAHKLRLQKEHAVIFKEESARYKNAIEGDWLEQREKMYEAMTSAEYLSVRSRLVEALLAWLGDILRQKADSPGLEFPDFAKATQRAASEHSLESLLERIAAVNDLRMLLETNVTEALALEVSFMKAFGPSVNEAA